MTFIKGMKPTKGFTGKKHTQRFRDMIREIRLRENKLRDKNGRFVKSLKNEIVSQLTDTIQDILLGYEDTLKQYLLPIERDAVRKVAVRDIIQAIAEHDKQKREAIEKLETSDCFSDNDYIKKSDVLALFEE